MAQITEVNCPWELRPNITGSARNRARISRPEQKEATETAAAGREDAEKACALATIWKGTKTEEQRHMLKNNQSYIMHNSQTVSLSKTSMAISRQNDIIMTLLLAFMAEE